MPDRIDFQDHLTQAEVQYLAAQKGIRFLQTSAPVDAYTWDLLNDQFFSIRPEVTLRVYGFYGLTCDLAFASKLSRVRHFCANCLMDATGLEHLRDMTSLESLSVGIYHLSDFGFLKGISPALKKLFLGATQSKKPDLSPLSRFTNIKEIYIEGQHKNIDVLAGLVNLEDVTLRSITTAGVDYLKPLRKMWSLDIKLGGIRDFGAIAEMENIQYLELWQIRGLTDIEAISHLTGLQFLFLQSLRQVTCLPSFERLSKLRRIILENMKGLKDLSSLEFAPGLLEYHHASAGNFQPEDFIPLLRNHHLKRADVLFGSKIKNQRFADLRRQYHIESRRILGEFQFDAVG